MFEGDFYGINAETVICCETKVQVDRVRVRIRWNTCFIIYKLGLNCFSYHDTYSLLSFGTIISVDIYIYDTA